MNKRYINDAWHTNYYNDQIKNVICIYLLLTVFLSRQITQFPFLRYTYNFYDFGRGKNNNSKSIKTTSKYSYENNIT